MGQLVFMFDVCVCVIFSPYLFNLCTSLVFRDLGSINTFDFNAECYWFLMYMVLICCFSLQANHGLEEELREINQRLIDTVVHISEDDVDPTAAAAATEGSDGIIVKCSFSAVSFSPNLKSHYASVQMVKS